MITRFATPKPKQKLGTASCSTCRREGGSCVRQGRQVYLTGEALPLAPDSWVCMPEGQAVCVQPAGGSPPQAVTGWRGTQ
jgi:hypothetical protein